MIVCKVNENGTRSYEIAGSAIEVYGDLVTILRLLKEAHDDICKEVLCKPFPKAIKCLAELAMTDREFVKETDVAYAVLETGEDPAGFCEEAQS